MVYFFSLYQPNLHFFGIRPQVPGNAPSLVATLADFRPEGVLLDYSIDTEAVLATAMNLELLSPVPLLNQSA